MAHDDMHVVMYKILAYLYRCLKAGEKADMRAIDADALGINRAYWTSIIEELVERGYVKGYRVVDVPSVGKSVTPIDPTVTMTGVEFLMENSMMRKAFDFLRESKDVVLRFI